MIKQYVRGGKIKIEKEKTEQNLREKRIHIHV